MNYLNRLEVEVSETNSIQDCYEIAAILSSNLKYSERLDLNSFFDLIEAKKQCLDLILKLKAGK